MTVIACMHVEAPAKTVFDFVKDPRNWERLPHSRVHIETLTRTKDGVGTFYSWRSKLRLGLPVSGMDVFTEYVPNQRLMTQSSRAFTGSTTFTCEPEGSGTRFTVDHRPRSFWALPVVGTLLSKLMRRAHEQVMSELKAELEAAESATAAQ